MAVGAQIPERRQTLTLDAIPSAVAQARRWAARVAAGLLSGEQDENLRLIISEVVRRSAERYARALEGRFP